MKPLKSARVPCWTLCTVSCSTDPRFWVGSKITVAVRPNDSLLPSSVSCTPSGTFTVEDGDGEGDEDADGTVVRRRHAIIVHAACRAGRDDPGQQPSNRSAKYERTWSS